jgi:glycosyltransferase involved in cell wall biosynthesis
MNNAVLQSTERIASSDASYQGVAVLIPCYNEELTVGNVVRDFRAVLPGARIIVFDNNSTDRTAEIARTHGADVIWSSRPGKGNVVQHMFETVDAEHYVMVDGDDTYPASLAPALIARLVETGADMVVGSRVAEHPSDSFRRFHRFGNRLVARLISILFRVKVVDVMSGFRVFSRTFVKTVPLMSAGFEIETEMTLQAVAKQFKIVEYPVTYGVRPEGSISKLNTYSDGLLVMRAIFAIFKDYKPQVFFSVLSVILATASLAAGLPPILEYVNTRWVSHVPLAILAASLGILAVLCLGIGLILGTVNRYHNESIRLWRRQLMR